MKSEVLLEAVRLSHAFRPDRRVLDDISIGFIAGELAVIAGRNGAGKTLLASCLAGLIEPSAGEVRFGGSGLRTLKGSHAARIAYIFQNAALQILGDSVLDDVLFGLEALGVEREEARYRAARALEAVSLAGKEGCIPWQLSGGEQRRLAIASQLALDPPVLILDEPFANLDWASISSVLSILIDLHKRGRTLIILTHELDKVLGLADRLIIMDAGRIVLDGEPESVLREGIEGFGLRDPLHHPFSIKDLLWLDPDR